MKRPERQADEDDGDDTVPLLAANAERQLNQGLPVDSQSQDALIQQFWRDKQQQDSVWRVVLVFAAACLWALLVSLYVAPHYSLLHSSFTMRLQSRFTSPHAPAATLGLLAASTAASLALLALIEPSTSSASSSESSPPSASLLWSPLFVSSSALAAAVWGLAVYVGAGTSNEFESLAVQWLWAVVFSACVLYYLACVLSLSSTRVLGDEIGRLAKLKYSYHTA